MKPSEKVAAMTVFQDRILLAGEMGTIVEFIYDPVSGGYSMRKIADVGWTP